MTLLAIRYALAAAVMAPLAVRRSRRSARPPGRLLFWLGAAVFNAFAAVSFWSAIKLGDVSQVAPITYLFPALVAVIAYLVFREPLGARTIAAVVIGVGGSVLVLGNGLARPVTLFAGGLALLSAVGTALYYVVASHGIEEDEWLPAAATIFAVGAVVFSPMLFLTGFEPPTERGWLLLGAIIVTGTILPFSLFLAGASRVGSVHAAILSVFEPVIAVSLALVILHEGLRVVQALGIALVLASFVVANAGRLRAPTGPQPAR